MQKAQLNRQAKSMPKPAPKPKRMPRTPAVEVPDEPEREPAARRKAAASPPNMVRQGGHCEGLDWKTDPSL